MKTAYDNTTQRWVVGTDAELVLAKQEIQRLKLLAINLSKSVKELREVATNGGVVSIGMHSRATHYCSYIDAL